MGNLFSVQVSCDALATRFCDCFAGQLNYLCKLKKNVDALRASRDELRELKNDVTRRVQIEEQNHLVRLDRVEGWVSRVEDMISEVDSLISIADSRQTVGLCLTLSCSTNFCSTLKLGKRVAEKLKDVENLLSRGHFEMVAENIPAPSVNERPSGLTVGLDGFLDTVWSCLHEERVGFLGLYGMGGVGKTTLLTQINNKFAITPNRFDVVIWVSVSKGQKLERIQDDIGKQLGFRGGKLSNQEGELSLLIYRTLRTKVFLLLLDDMWERIDLLSIGIPLPNRQNGSKIIMTARSAEVCGLMEVDEKIEMKCLEWNDAWELFQKKVGHKSLQEHPDIVELAKKMASRCCGLPLALITVGRAMACRNTPEEWRNAINVLQASTSEFPGMENGVFPLLKLSYDCLSSENTKSCFLYCALFPVDFSINKEELIDYLIGEGILNGYDKNNDAKNQGYYIIGTLVNMSLLIEVEDNFIKMHDVLRDVALWIARECEREKEHVYVQAGARLRVAPEAAKWEEVKRISLMVNCIENLTETPKCPKLLSLHLSDNLLAKFTSDFFQFMPALTVLDLSKNASEFELPEGISVLSSLQYLNLSESGITRLPIGFKELKNLKYLNLDHTFFLEKIPKHILSSLLSLEVLRVTRCGGVLQMPDDNILTGGRELLVKELKRLERLNILHIGIRSASSLQRFLSHTMSLLCTEVMSLEAFEDEIEVDISFLANMTRLRSFYMWNSLCSVKVGVKSHFTELCKVNIGHCLKLKDLTWLVLAPNLTHLYLSYCPELKEVISRHKSDEVESGGNLNLFGKLEVLQLIHLESLEIVYDTPLPLLYLKKIFIYDCPHLKKLPLANESAPERQVVITADERWKHILKRERTTTISIICAREVPWKVDCLCSLTHRYFNTSVFVGCLLYLSFSTWYLFCCYPFLCL